MLELPFESLLLLYKHCFMNNKPINTSEHYASYPAPYPIYETNEISFVDVTVTLIKHLKLTFVVFIISALISNVYLFFFKEEKYQITSILEIGYINSNTPIESVASSKAKLVNGLIPKLLRENNTEKRYFVDVNTTKDTSLIQLISYSSTADLDAYKNIHQQLINTIYSQQKEISDNKRNALNTRLDAIKLRTNNNKTIDPSLSAELLDGQVLLNSIIDSKIVVLAQQAIQPSGLPKSTVVFIAFIVSAFIGISCAFILEFSLKVRNALE